MQLHSELSSEKSDRICNAICKERIYRYKAASYSDKVPPLDLYSWNCALSESFYIPLHFAEIVCRNALHESLVGRIGAVWYNDALFKKILDSGFEKELENAIYSERRQHADGMTGNHVVSALSFGFWEHLTTKRFRRRLFPKGISEWFPNATHNATIHDLNQLIQSVRRWRNRIAHHHAIFDKGPARKHDDALKLIRWRCGQTAKWVSDASRVSAIIQARPKSDAH